MLAARRTFRKGLRVLLGGQKSATSPLGREVVRSAYGTGLPRCSAMFFVKTPAFPTAALSLSGEMLHLLLHHSISHGSSKLTRERSMGPLFCRSSAIGRALSSPWRRFPAKTYGGIQDCCLRRHDPRNSPRCLPRAYLIKPEQLLSGAVPPNPLIMLVPLARLERARLATTDFESAASTSSATGAACIGVRLAYMGPAERGQPKPVPF